MLQKKPSICYVPTYYYDLTKKLVFFFSKTNNFDGLAAHFYLLLALCIHFNYKSGTSKQIQGNFGKPSRILKNSRKVRR